MQIFKKFVQLIGFFEREAAAARAAQGGEVRPAVERMIEEADTLAASGQSGPSLDELFGED